jgi:hypothetical protein
MAFSDPIAVIVNAVSKSLPRVYSPAPGPSIFKTADDEFRVEISHADVKGRRERHFIRLTQRKVAADPLTPATNVESKASVYLVLDNPVNGYSDTELGYLMKALNDYLVLSTNPAKFIGGEA